VTKNELMLTSLVGAIPGLALSIVVVMGFLNHAGGWPLTKGLSAAMLLMGVMLTLMPVAIFLKGGPKAAKKPAEEAKPAEAESAAATVDESPSEESAVAAVEAGSSEFDLGADFDEEPEKK
jgi:hypothetical protein